jgi:hypothetical protein
MYIYRACTCFEAARWVIRTSKNIGARPRKYKSTFSAWLRNVFSSCEISRQWPGVQCQNAVHPDAAWCLWASMTRMLNSWAKCVVISRPWPVPCRSPKLGTNLVFPEALFFFRRRSLFELLNKNTWPDLTGSWVHFRTSYPVLQASRFTSFGVNKLWWYLGRTCMFGVSTTLHYERLNKLNIVTFFRCLIRRILDWMMGFIDHSKLH